MIDLNERIAAYIDGHERGKLEIAERREQESALVVKALKRLCREWFPFVWWGEVVSKEAGHDDAIHSVLGLISALDGGNAYSIECRLTAMNVPTLHQARKAGWDGNMDSPFPLDAFACLSLNVTTKTLDAKSWAYRIVKIGEETESTPMLYERDVVANSIVEAVGDFIIKQREGEKND